MKSLKVGIAVLGLVSGLLVISIFSIQASHAGSERGSGCGSGNHDAELDPVNLYEPPLGWHELFGMIGAFADDETLNVLADESETHYGWLQRNPETRARLSKLESDFEKLWGIKRVRWHDSRVPREFAALGEMYQMCGFILSDIAPYEMTQPEALAYCESIGSALPTIVQVREMQELSLNGPYRDYRLVIPNLAHSFWTSNLFTRSYGPGFEVYSLYNGHSRNIYDDFGHKKKSVRCVVPAM